MARVGIVGATGVIGSELLSCMEHARFAFDQVRLFASRESVGELYQVGSEECQIEELDQGSFSDLDLVLFATPNDVTDQYLPFAIESSASVVLRTRSKADDSTGVHVAATSKLGLKPAKILVSAHPSVVVLAPVIAEIAKLAAVKHITISSYQSVSSAGKAALDELWEQTRAVFNQKPYEGEAFQHQVAFNCVPQIEVMLEDSSTREETQVCSELSSVLDLAATSIDFTAVRVPVFHADSFSLNIQTDEPVKLSELIKQFDKDDKFRFYGSLGDYPLARDVTSTDEIHIGRMRANSKDPRYLNLWVVADNLRRGVALNMLELGKRLLAT